jgi:hypothetical protein
MMMMVTSWFRSLSFYSTERRRKKMNSLSLSFRVLLLITVVHVAPPSNRKLDQVILSSCEGDIIEHLVDFRELKNWYF